MLCFFVCDICPPLRLTPIVNCAPAVICSSEVAFIAYDRFLPLNSRSMVLTARSVGASGQSDQLGESPATHTERERTRRARRGTKRIVERGINLVWGWLGGLFV